MTTTELIESLRALEQKLQDKNLDMDRILPLDDYRSISILADCVLIDANGRRNIDAIQTLADAGYEVFPLEKDRFGWLIGGIQTKCGIIVFG